MDGYTERVVEGDFSYVEPGDTVTRMLAGEVPMRLVVTAVEGGMICCGDWMFRRDTGCEVDQELGWDGVTVTGSFLVHAAQEVKPPKL